jgi:hypothetical protein
MFFEIGSDGTPSNTLTGCRLFLQLPYFTPHVDHAPFLYSRRLYRVQLKQ